MSQREKIGIANYTKYNNAGHSAFPVKAGFWNALIDWLTSFFPTDGAAKLDTVDEYTSGGGVTIENVLIKDGKVGNTIAYTANATGTSGAILGAYEHVAVITSTNVNHIVSLPLLASVPTGAHIQGIIVNTGCELRAHPTNLITNVTVNNVSATGGTEIALGNTAGKYFDAVKVQALKWLVSAVSSTGAYRANEPN